MKNTINTNEREIDVKRMTSAGAEEGTPGRELFSHLEKGEPEETISALLTESMVRSLLS